RVDFPEFGLPTRATNPDLCTTQGSSIIQGIRQERFSWEDLTGHQHLNPSVVCFFDLKAKSVVLVFFTFSRNPPKRRADVTRDCGIGFAIHVNVEQLLHSSD